jgi:hypothetical protein
MSNYYNRQWRLPNEENKSKVSNYSMNFDSASSQFIDLGTTLDPYYKYVSTVSFSVWVNFKDLTTDVTVLGTWRTSNHMLDIRFLQSTGKLSFRVGFGADTGGEVEVISSGKIVANTWYHLAMVYDGTQIGNADRLKAYINGSQETLTFTGVIPSTTSTLLVRRFEIGGNYLNKDGLKLLDGVAIFNYALSSSQVTTLYGSSSTGIGNPISLSPKPVAYYPLGDQDSFNGANYLVPNSSLKDYVFNFDGSNDTIGLGTSLNSVLNGYSSSFTISCWINASDSSNRKGIISNYTGIGTYIDLINISSTTFKLQGGYHTTSASSGFVLRQNNTNLSINTWHNIILVVNSGGASGSVDMYINGSLDNGTEYHNTTQSYSNTNNLYISTNLGYVGNFFNGSISNTQIFNTTLSSTDVETLYNNGSPLTSMTGFTSLQGWWKLDASATYDGSNWTIEDSSSNSNDGTSSGMTQANLVQSDLSFTSGYSPFALDFDGANDYIDCGNDSSLVPSSLTISLWFKTSGSASAIPRLLNKSYGGSPYDSYFIRINNGVLNFKIGVSSASVQIAGTTNVVDGEWHNVIGTYDGSQLKLYLDGNSEATPVSETRAIVGNTSFNLTLGCELGAYGFSWPFTGSMSNVSIWNVGLTSAQVTEIYNEGVPSNLNNHSAYSNLLSWWQLGSNSSFNTNWTVLDEKGSNNGTSVNMTEDDIVDGVGSSANGTSSGMGGDEVVGSAPFSDANSLSVNMDVEDRTTDTPS